MDCYLTERKSTIRPPRPPAGDLLDIGMLSGGIAGMPAIGQWRTLAESA